MIEALAGVCLLLTGIGVAQALVAAGFVAAWCRDHGAAASGALPGPDGEEAQGRQTPAVTILKPLHGDEPLLEQALETVFRQDYPVFQIVFGVADIADPAVAVVQRLRARFPGIDAEVVVDSSVHGANRKVCNLINMFPVARHDVVVIADSDVHAQADYLHRLVGALMQPGVGLVTTLYAGLPADRALPAQLGATAITHGFLPGAVLARRLGRQDCLGATMCLRRRDLERIGGFEALVSHLADDNVLGRRIIGLGLRVALAGTVPLTTVPEASFSALFRHELRWARTIRALAPAGFAASVLQYPLTWALLVVALAGGAVWAIGAFMIAWVLRALAALWVDRALARLWAPRWTPWSASDTHGSNDNAALAFSCPVWLLPVRDILSVAVMLASYGGRRVEWRGQNLHADTPPPVATEPNPIEGMNLR